MKTFFCLSFFFLSISFSFSQSNLPDGKGTTQMIVSFDTSRNAISSSDIKILYKAEKGQPGILISPAEKRKEQQNPVSSERMIQSEKNKEYNRENPK